MSILVIGAGAIGGITAAFLKKNGYNVEIISKYEDYATLIREQGMEISGISGSFTVTVPAYASVDEVKGKKDLILHATKVNDMVEAARSVLPVLSENGYLVSLQNGICEDVLAGIVGQERIIGCVTGWGATMEARGRLVMTSTGDFILGYPDKEADDDLKTVADILSRVVPVRISDNIMGHLYSKLIINANITSLGVICGLDLGKMLAIKKIRNIFIEVIREAVSLADKINIKIEVFGGRLDFRKFISGNSILADFRRHMLIRIIGFKYRRLKSSSLQSFERGKPTEVDFLNGYIVRNAEKTGVDVPVNRAILNMIHEIEQGRRKISPDNFDDPVFDRF